jgi:hypothetical protein
MDPFVLGAGLVALSSTLAAIIMAASGVDPTLWTTGGVGSAIVGSLLYLVKRMTDGSLVSMKVPEIIQQGKDREDRLRLEAEKRDEALHAIADRLNTEAETREQKLRDIAKRGQDREDLLWALLKAKGAA